LISTQHTWEEVVLIGRAKRPVVISGGLLGCKVFSKPIDVQELVGWLNECEGRIDPARMLVEIPPELLLGGTP